MKDFEVGEKVAEHARVLKGERDGLEERTTAWRNQYTEVKE